jgi:DNA-binding protein H-NS
MAKATLASMSVDALLRLREQVQKALGRMAGQLEDQLSRLPGGFGSPKKGRRSPLKGRKAPVKYRDQSGNAWAGRGALPVWLREELKAGAKLEDFTVNKAVSRKASRKKPTKRRKGRKVKRQTTKARKVKGRAIKARKVKRQATKARKVRAQNVQRQATPPEQVVQTSTEGSTERSLQTPIQSGAS